ncbi:hypothetical protein [Streptomyces sp. SCL15-6]|jgi:hypothetical protein|nr:hypothetical protein [Streptomyces sp. SCL15-6]
MAATGFPAHRLFAIALIVVSAITFRVSHDADEQEIHAAFQ